MLYQNLQQGTTCRNDPTYNHGFRKLISNNDVASSIGKPTVVNQFKLILVELLQKQQQHSVILISIQAGILKTDF